MSTDARFIVVAMLSSDESVDKKKPMETGATLGRSSAPTGSPNGQRYIENGMRLPCLSRGQTLCLVEMWNGLMILV